MILKEKGKKIDLTRQSASQNRFHVFRHRSHISQPQFHNSMQETMDLCRRHSCWFPESLESVICCSCSECLYLLFWRVIQWAQVGKQLTKTTSLSSRGMGFVQRSTSPVAMLCLRDDEGDICMTMCTLLEEDHFQKLSVLGKKASLQDCKETVPTHATTFFPQRKSFDICALQSFVS